MEGRRQEVVCQETTEGRLAELKPVFLVVVFSAAYPNVKHLRVAGIEPIPVVFDELRQRNDLAVQWLHVFQPAGKSAQWLAVQVDVHGVPGFRLALVADDDRPALQNPYVGVNQRLVRLIRRRLQIRGRIGGVEK